MNGSDSTNPGAIATDLAHRKGGENHRQEGGYGAGPIAARDSSPNLNYFRFWIADYGKDTASLSVSEHGAYLLLLMAYYSGGPLPDELDQLYRLCRAMNASEQDAVARVAKRFFPVNGDGRRHNKRADAEIAKALDAIDVQSRKGKEGAEKRWTAERARRSADVIPLNRVADGIPDGVADGIPDGVTGASSQPLSLLASVTASTAQELSHPTPKAEKHSAARSASASKESRTAKVWSAYSAAFKERYGVEPVRNARVNGQLCKFLDAVPADEAPGISASYVRSSRSIYVSAKHPVSLLLRDAEGLRTEWATGRQVTETEARQMDRTQANGNAFTALISESRKGAQQ